MSRLGKGQFQHYSMLIMENRQSHRWTRKWAACGWGAVALFALLICLWLVALVGAAQALPRDYVISPPRVYYSAGGEVAVVSFTVSNQGGDASEPSQIIISEYQSGRVEISEQLPPLAAEQAREFSIQLPLANLSADGIVSFKIDAGIDDFELANSPIASNNSQLFHIDRAAASQASGNEQAASAADQAGTAFDLYIPLVDVGINLLADGIQLNDSRYSGGDMLRAIGLLAFALFCLWLLSLALRLLFRRPPRFEVWQPPYAVNNFQDPNSALGRRQSWQFHAQNSTLAAPSAPDQVTVLKRLLNKRGTILGGWQVIALRTVQYDVYGRINRTEVLMPRKLIKQLNRVLRRAPDYVDHELQKRLKPIANRLCKHALGPVEKQNLMLPFALEIRFEGATEQIRIQFELYQYQSDAWRLIDKWEPELGLVGEQVPEQFAFTLNGQLSGESKQEYKSRLREDMTRLLAGLFYQREAEEDSAPPGKPESGDDLFSQEGKLWGDAPANDETGPSSISIGAS